MPEYPIYVSTDNTREDGNCCYGEVILYRGLPEETVVYRSKFWLTHSLALADCKRHVRGLLNLHEREGQP